MMNLAALSCISPNVMSGRANRLSVKEKGLKAVDKVLMILLAHFLHLSCGPIVTVHKVS